MQVRAGCPDGHNDQLCVQECPALAATLAAAIQRAPATFGALAAHHADAAQQQAPAAAQRPLKSDSAQDMALDAKALPVPPRDNKASSADVSNSSGSGSGGKQPAGAAASLQRDDSASALDLIAALRIGDKAHPEGFRRKRPASSGQPAQVVIRE